ncbi:MAG: hypothetical protein HY582_01800 [Candidatus Omnitrophica bacterium]|nr:hypothetical protein [Candidatus Omnitrophota bacterium]
MIQSQKEWSWSLAAISFLVLALVLRHIVLHHVFRKLKQMPRDLRRNIQNNYAKRSILGWILFSASIAIATVLWAKPELLNTHCPNVIWYLIVLILLSIAILGHAQAYLAALLQFVEDKMLPNEKEV